MIHLHKHDDRMCTDGSKVVTGGHADHHRFWSVRGRQGRERSAWPRFADVDTLSLNEWRDSEGTIAVKMRQEVPTIDELLEHY